MADYRGPGARLSGRAFSRTSHLARRTWLAFGFAGSAAPSLRTLGRRAGRPWCPPSLLRHVLRVRKGRPLTAAHVSIWPTAAPLVRNSPRGWTPRSLTAIRSAGRRAVGVDVAARGRYGGRADTTFPVRRAFSWPPFSWPLRCLARTISARRGSAVWQCRRASSRSGAALSARPTRTSGSGRVFGAHPRGEFRTSGAAVGQIDTWAARAAFLVERGGRV
jgi:hypothetical protein